MTAMHPPILVPFALKHAPALIEKVFPAQKVSFEAQRERKAGAGQTLTALGSYWKGRKPLILVRAIILGSLLPSTDDAEKDLEIFEALLGFDIQGLGRRAVAQADLKPNQIASIIDLENPWDFFSYTIARGASIEETDVKRWKLPFDADERGVNLSWRRGLTDEEKSYIYAKALESFPTYEERSLLCKRPEEIDQDFLYAPVWPKLNAHLSHFGINANSTGQLVEQLGMLRYGHCPKIGDTFSGGGSIPFEAARIGCDVYASDLNPVACMLTWGSINVLGASKKIRNEIEIAQQRIAEAVDSEVRNLSIEFDKNGNRAKVYLYCVEVKCPETGWVIPLAPNWVISMQRNVIAQLIPNHDLKRFDIEIKSSVTLAEMNAAKIGTVRGESIVYVLHGKTYSNPLRTLRGDFRTPDGETRNRLRHWEISDFKPLDSDLFQERLYAIQWISKNTLSQDKRLFFRQ
jgi:putative DNA methylase